MEPISRDEVTKDIIRNELATALTTALTPLLNEMKEMRSDIQGLKLNSAPRTDVYAKDVMDEKLGAVQTGIEALKLAMLANREFTWKVVGIIGTAATLFAYFAPHFIWRP